MNVGFPLDECIFEYIYKTKNIIRKAENKPVSNCTQLISLWEIFYTSVRRTLIMSCLPEHIYLKAQLRRLHDNHSNHNL